VPQGAGSLPAKEEAADGRRQARGHAFLPQQVGSEHGTRAAQNRRVLWMGWEE